MLSHKLQLTLQRAKKVDFTHLKKIWKSDVCELNVFFRPFGFRVYMNPAQKQSFGKSLLQVVEANFRVIEIFDRVTNVHASFV